MGRRQRIGKLDAKTLAELLKRYARPADRSVLLGPGVGLDAAAIRVPAGTLVLASDPVTYATDRLGRYAVAVNANDIYVSGAKPRWFLADILLPPGQARLAESIFRDLSWACRELGVSLIGGHTEMTPGLPRPMVTGFMIGQLIGPRPLSAAGVKSGDCIVLTKGLAIEGTAIIARERSKKLSGEFSQGFLRRASRFLSSPGLSVGPEAMIATGLGAHALHDPTEGGLLNGLWEMSQACGLALHIDTETIFIYQHTRRLCQSLGLDPLGLLASGALVIACAPRRVKNLCKRLDKADILNAVIGRARRGPPAVHFSDGRSVKKSVTDQILKVFKEA